MNSLKARCPTAFRWIARLWAARPLALAVAVPAVALAAVMIRTGAAAGDASSSRLLFSGTNKSAWRLDQSATVTRIRRVPNPSGTGTALRFQTYDQDVFPLTPTSNPRSQLLTPLGVKVGGQFWESYEVFLPRSFPLAASRHSWISLGSPAFGPPWAGTPPAELSIVGGDFRFQRNGFASDPWQVAWQAPIVLGRWIRFTWHVMLSQNGYVQLWMNNQPLELADGSSSSTTLYMPVIDQTDTRGPWFSQLAVYYKHGTFPQLTVYFRDFRIATTEALAVAG